MRINEILLPMHLIGIGAAGSSIGELLIRHGCGKRNELHFWDGDIVSASNLKSQKYVTDDIGKYKTVALAQHAEQWGGVPVIEHQEFIDGPRDLSGIVFLCVDKMNARKKILEECIQERKSIELMIEVRMEETNILIHIIDPREERHIKVWNHYWYPDEEATNTLGCNGPESICSTASACAVISVWQLIRFADILSGGSDVLDMQIRINMRTLEIVKEHKW